MKLLKLSIVCLLFTAFIACGDDDDGAETTNNSADLRVDVDGVNFEPGLIVSQMTSMGRYLAITSSESAGMGNSLAIAIGSLDEQDPVLAVGTYSTVEGQTAIIYTIEGTTTYQTFMSEATAQITITALNTSERTISGTFQGTVKNLISGETIELTNGEFNDLSYTDN